jgi:hypothetical protein
VRCACDEGVKDPANRIGLPKRKEIADECDDYHQPISGTEVPAISLATCQGPTPRSLK